MSSGSDHAFATLASARARVRRDEVDCFGRVVAVGRTGPRTPPAARAAAARSTTTKRTSAGRTRREDDFATRSASDSACLVVSHVQNRSARRRVDARARPRAVERFRLARLEIGGGYLLGGVRVPAFRRVRRARTFRVRRAARAAAGRVARESFAIPESWRVTRARARPRRRAASSPRRAIDETACQCARGDDDAAAARPVSSPLLLERLVPPPPAPSRLRRRLDELRGDGSRERPRVQRRRREGVRPGRELAPTASR